MWWCVDEAFESYVDVETDVDAEVHVDVEVDVDVVTAAVAVLVAAEVLVRAVSDCVDVGVGAHAHAPAHAHVDVGIGIDTGVDVAVVLHDDVRARCAVHVGPASERMQLASAILSVRRHLGSMFATCRTVLPRVRPQRETGMDCCCRAHHGKCFWCFQSHIVVALSL